ncbi:MAG: type VI secretion system baseplate subunit TssE [Acidobacteriia bacterium]|nr:type VI secretion system baseplate subunit TssE [Terriglobia bacterium]
MSRFETDSRIALSVLDRLIDCEPGNLNEAPASRAESLRQLKESVRRDLEWLLNTRRPIHEISAELKETLRSLAVYGVSDFSTLSARNLADQERMCRVVQDAIRTFEPRLRDVTVTAEPGREFEHMLHFRIRAYLEVEPAPEQVNFDTSLQIFSTEFKVQGD